MVVLWQKFDSAEDFKKWAFGVARLETLKFLQSRARDRHVFDDELANRLADDMVSMEQRHFSQREALGGCLQKLGDAQRELTFEAYTKGVRMNELARHGKTPMAIYKLLHVTATPWVVPSDREGGDRMSADWHDTIQRYMSGSTTREESEALEDALKNDAELRLLYLDYLNLDLALEAKAETSGELAEIVPISDLNSAPASSRKPMRSVLAIAAVFALLLSLATLFFKPTSEPAAWVWQATGTQTVSVGESLSPGRVVNLLSGQVRIRFAWAPSR